MKEEEQQQQPTSPESDHQHERKTMEKFWGATVETWNSATFRANQYKRIVQKKIDLTSLHKKISTAHADLGKKIDDLYQNGNDNVMEHPDVMNMLKGLGSMRQAAAGLEEEIVKIKNEEPPEEEIQPPTGGNA